MSLQLVRETWYASISVRGVNKKLRRVRINLHLKKSQRIKAREMHDLFEKFASTAMTERNGMTRLDVMDAIERIVCAIGLTGCMDDTVASYALTWLTELEGEVKDSTYVDYKTKALAIAKWGYAKKLTLNSTSPQDVKGFRDELLADGYAPGTVNSYISRLQSFFQHAVDKGLCLRNPVDPVKRCKADDTLKRIAFTDEEVELLLKHSKGEMHDAILLASTIGSAISDTAGMQWNNVNFEKGYIEYERRKTGTNCIYPFRNGLREMLERRWKAGVGVDKGMIFPIYASGVARIRNPSSNQGTTALSNAFLKLIKEAGIDQAFCESKAKEGRTLSRKSWHSLRRYAIDKAIDDHIPEDVRMKMFGHGDKLIHRKYATYDIARICNYIPDSEASILKKETCNA
tara:strand:- start:13802 stop:15004 length:1203 start_codon:yes stop_codon:yes gene_type:complete